MRCLIHFFAAVTFILLVGGCGVLRQGTKELDQSVRKVVEGEPDVPEKPSPFSTQEKLVGGISLVNTRGNFVLVRSPRGESIPDEVELYTLNKNSRRTSRLRLSPEKKSSFYVADILQGSPSIGDRVMMEGIVDETGRIVWGAPSKEDATEDERQTLE